MLVKGHQDEESVDALKVVLSRRQGVCDRRVSETEKNGAGSKGIRCRKDDFEIRLEKKEEGEIVRFAKVDKRLRMNSFKSKARKHLTQDIPSISNPICIEGRLFGERKSKPKSIRPGVPESLTRFRRERGLCIRIDRGMTP
jgi:hypothetical protein